MPPSGDDLKTPMISALRLATAAQLLTFLAAFLGLFGRVWYFAAISGGFALFLYVASLILGSRERRQVQTRVDRLADAVDLHHVLRETAESLGLRRTTQEWRLSLYRLDFGSGQVERGRWKLEARAANQQAHEISKDLLEMSLKQGVLRTAVESADQPLGGIDEMPQIPDRSADPQAWKSVMSAWGFDEAEISGGMRSRAYCGRVFRVGLSRGKGLDMTLGLVAESDIPTGVHRQAMEDVLTRPVFELLYELIRLKDDMRKSLAGLSGQAV
ncbi:MAG: hypothetical protein ACRC0L_07915 [Angustibacter sp.]